MLATHWPLTIGFSIWLAFTPVYAKINSHAPDGGDPEKVKASLALIQEKIQNLEKNLYQSQSQERDQIKQLAVLEKEIGEREETLRQLEESVLQHGKMLTKLQHDYQESEQLNKTQQAVLAKLIQSTFQHYHKEKLRLLMEPNETSTLSRLNHYYQIFYQARTDKLQALQTDLKNIQELQLRIIQEQTYAQELKQKLFMEKLEFAHNKQERENVLAALTKKLNGDKEQLQILQKQEQHLDQLFKALQQQLALTPSFSEPHAHFAKMKRQLSLPINLPQAKLVSLPGTAKNQKKSYIAAQEGTPVMAIFAGNVVFAEWLRGVGLLVIIDHGHGYMTLYGNNQKLYKNIGDKVSQGEMIARVGQSGGHAEPGLYFEIRKDGEALDPAPWFKKELS